MVGGGGERHCRDTGGFWRSKAGSRVLFQELDVTVREFRFLKDTSFNELEVPSRLATESALPQEVNMVVAARPQNIRSAQNQVSLANDVLSKADINGALEFMSSVMALGAHGRIFCSHLVLAH